MAIDLRRAAEGGGEGRKSIAVLYFENLGGSKEDEYFRDGITEDITTIARELRLALSEQEQRAIRKIPTADVQAYDLYLRGRQFFHQFRRKGFDFAREMFAKAIELDPAFARAYAGIADCSAFLYFYWDSSETRCRPPPRTGADYRQLRSTCCCTPPTRALSISARMRCRR